MTENENRSNDHGGEETLEKELDSLPILGVSDQTTTRSEKIKLKTIVSRVPNAESRSLYAQRGFWRLIRILVFLLSATHFFRTSWTVQNMFKSGAKYAEQWSIYSSKVLRGRDDLVFQDGGYTLSDLSERMKTIHRQQLSAEVLEPSYRSSVNMELMSIEHTSGNDRCKKMRGTYFLNGGDEWKSQWLVFLVEETMLIAQGTKDFTGADARTKSLDPVSLISEGYWATRRSMDIRTLGGLEGIDVQIEGGELPMNGTEVSFTLPGNRFNLKSTCMGCEDTAVMFSYYCDIRATVNRTEDGVKFTILKSSPSQKVALNQLGIGLSIIWTWRMTAGDVFRGLAQLIMAYYFIMLQGYGLLPSKLIFDMENENARPNRFNVKLMLRKWNLLPERVGGVQDGVPPYFFQHNSWILITFNSLALISDSLMTIAYIREAGNYALYANDFWPIYWMCIYGLRFMWFYLAVMKVLKTWLSRLQYRKTLRGLTCVWYNYMTATLLSMFITEDITTSLYGQEVEFQGMPSVADSLTVSFFGGFFVIRLAPYCLTLLLVGSGMFIINFVANSFWMRYTNSLDSFIIENTSCVCGTIGLTSGNRNSERKSFQYLSDAGTLLHVAWILNNSISIESKDPNSFASQYAVAPWSDRGKGDKDALTTSGKAVIIESPLKVQYSFWREVCTIVLERTNMPMVSHPDAFAIAFAKPAPQLLVN